MIKLKLNDIKMPLREREIWNIEHFGISLELSSSKADEKGVAVIVLHKLSFYRIKMYF